MEEKRPAVAESTAGLFVENGSMGKDRRKKSCGLFDKIIPPDRIAQLNNLLHKSRWVPPLLFHAPFLQQPAKAVPGGLQSAGGDRAPFQSSVGLYVRSPRIGQGIDSSMQGEGRVSLSSIRGRGVDYSSSPSKYASLKRSSKMPASLSKRASSSTSCSCSSPSSSMTSKI